MAGEMGRTGVAGVPDAAIAVACNRCGMGRVTQEHYSLAIIVNSPVVVVPSTACRAAAVVFW